MNAQNENIPLTPIRDLLADEAAAGLDARQWMELERALSAGDISARGDLEFLELAAAAADLALMRGHVEAMPDTLKARLSQTVPATIAIEKARASTPPAAIPMPARQPMVVPARYTSTSSLSWVPWLLAAACLAIAGSLWVSRPLPSSVPGQGVASAARLSLDALKRDTRTAQIPWQPGNDESVGKVTGEVVWNNELQQGYVRFKGLAANDPSKEQYQLWVVDKAQEKPIDAGVFDISKAMRTASGDILLPLAPHLRVNDPQLIAVTVERPGGVVVSDLKRIACMAPVKKS